MGASLRDPLAQTGTLGREERPLNHAEKTLVICLLWGYVQRLLMEEEFSARSPLDGQESECLQCT